VHSDGEGLGSEFSVQLPIRAKPPLEELLPLDVMPARDCHILLVDDNTDTNDLLNIFLTLEGQTVTSAYDGVTGLALARENVYDVIVCDIGLPLLNGHEVMAQLRRDTSRRMPCAIAVTGYNSLGSRARASAAGFDHYLVKPIVVGNLRTLIAASVSPSWCR
jgi:CheY-like chemotaxis protein